MQTPSSSPLSISAAAFTMLSCHPRQQACGGGMAGGLSGTMKAVMASKFWMSTHPGIRAGGVDLIAEGFTRVDGDEACLLVRGLGGEGEFVCDSC